jgi:hypothetical protein
MQNKIQETTFIKPITTVTLSIKKKVNVVSRGLQVPLEKKKCTKKYLNAYLNWDIKPIAPTNTGCFLCYMALPLLRNDQSKEVQERTISSLADSVFIKQKIIRFRVLPKCEKRFGGTFFGAISAFLYLF